MSEFAKIENRLVELARLSHGDNAPEFLVGLLCSVVSEEQILALITNIENGLHTRVVS